MPNAARRIDVHCHFTPEFYRAEVLAAGLMPTSGVYPAWSPELALEFMDGHGIETSIISIPHPGVHFGDSDKARTTARRCNEIGADLAARWPQRFGVFLTAPMPDVDNALAEIAHAFDELGLDGVCLLASYQGKFLGDPTFDPVMEELNRRGATVFIHPSMHPSAPSIGLKWPIFVMEFLFDTTRAVVNLLYAGALERYPRIKFILAHAGGLVPYFAWRLSVAPMVSPILPQWPQECILAMLRRFWFDTALSAGRQTMGSLSEVADPDKILFGSDWPPAGPHAVQAGIDALAEPGYLTDQTRAAIERGNAVSLFPRFA